MLLGRNELVGQPRRLQDPIRRVGELQHLGQETGAESRRKMWESSLARESQRCSEVEAGYVVFLEGERYAGDSGHDPACGGARSLSLRSRRCIEDAKGGSSGEVKIR